MATQGCNQSYTIEPLRTIHAVAAAVVEPPTATCSAAPSRAGSMSCPTVTTPGPGLNTGQASGRQQSSEGWVAATSNVTTSHGPPPTTTAATGAHIHNAAATAAACLEALQSIEPRSVQTSGPELLGGALAVAAVAAAVGGSVPASPASATQLREAHTPTLLLPPVSTSTTPFGATPTTPLPCKYFCPRQLVHLLPGVLVVVMMSSL
jgi:hypothetical protein